MSVWDGFTLWIGKTLAEIAIVVAILLLLAVGFFVLIGIAKFDAWRKKRRAPPQPEKPA